MTEEKSTKKQKTALAAAGILLLVQILIYAFLTLSVGKSGGETKELLIEGTAEEIAGIAYRAPDGTTLSFFLKEGKWMLNAEECDLSGLAAEDLPGNGDPSSWNIRQEAVRILVSGVTGIAVRQVIEKPSDPGQYGLDDPFTEVRILRKDGTETTLTISDTAESSRAVYVLRDGDAGKVYVCIPALRENFEKTISDFVSP